MKNWKTSFPKPLYVLDAIAINDFICLPSFLTGKNSLYYSELDH